MSSSSKKEETEELHCVRCHENFIPHTDNDNDEKESSSSSSKSCIIEHDTDTFEGSRNGSSWYTGTLGCCGAAYKFHRHDSREKADPAYCFLGSHTTDPDEVRYNKCSIVICTVDKCGKELHTTTQEAHERQKQAKKQARHTKNKKRADDKASNEAKRQKLLGEGKTREARQLRAQILGIDSDDDDLNSDIDPDGCAEFDYASDSSLVPPGGFVQFGGDSDGDY